MTGKVRFGDNSVVHIKGKGSITIHCNNGERRRLKGVYYIPSLCSSIISLGQLVEEGHKVVWSGECLWIRDKCGALLIKVNRTKNRLYTVNLQTGSQECLLTRCEDKDWLWYCRMGHVNFKALTLMSSINMEIGLPRIAQPKEICTGCLMSKQTRKGFPKQSEFHTTKALELVHGDLCGPITPSTPGGNRYIFLLVDDYTRVMWCYLLKGKDEAFHAFKKF